MGRRIGDTDGKKRRKKKRRKGKIKKTKKNVLSIKYLVMHIMSYL